MAEPWTVRRMLLWMAADFQARGIASARLDAELLLSHALDCDRVRLYLDYDRPLIDSELETTRELVRRRRSREPVAYILGEKEFYRRGFRVSSAVLVPRPETELLVDRALERLSEGPQRALDLCTGSAVIAITLAAERPELVVDATDICERALAVAQDNVERHGVGERLVLHRGDLFEALRQARRYALITANPPYVAEAQWQRLAPDVREHEPRAALLAGPDGLDVIRDIITGAAEWLEPGGRLLLEVGAGQAPQVLQHLQSDARYEQLSVQRDLGGIERVVEASRHA